ncbi:hypothetical protein GDO81_029468 [Engystomops pustulosus]|uniref:Uncharacterized protein n=1 Tax=Engystomops pustulosus TaxID=76066 RepID=A0AAV6ZHV0_ENGPU|nr:hypothetical protein GDO81_029468 [Engystomops pustulosus]
MYQESHHHEEPPRHHNGLLGLGPKSLSWRTIFTRWKSSWYVDVSSGSSSKSSCCSAAGLGGSLRETLLCSPLTQTTGCGVTQFRGPKSG